MTKIAALGGTGRVGRSAPRASSKFQGSGIQGKALAQLGKTILSSGQQASEAFAILEDKRRKAEILDFGDTKSFEFRKGLNQRLREDKQAHSGGDHKGYSAGIQEFIEGFREAVVSDSEDEEAIQHFNNRIRAVSEKTMNQSDNYESVERSKHFFNNKLDQAQKVATAILDNPDPFQANTEITNFQATMEAQKGLSFTAKQIDTVMDGLREDSRDSLVFSQIRDGLPGLVSESMTPQQKRKSIKNFLDGKLEGTENLFQGMSSKEKRIYSNRLAKALDIQEKRESNEINEMVKNIVKLYEKEDTFDPRIRQEIAAVKLRLGALPPSDKKTRMATAIDNAELVSEFIKGSTTLSNRELVAMNLDDLIPLTGLTTADIDLDSRKAIENSKADILEERKDGKAYLNKVFPNLKISTEASIAQQKQWGIFRPRVTSEPEASIQSAAILDETSPRLRAQRIRDVVDREGSKYGFQALSEMADANKDFHRGYAFSAFFNNPMTQEKVITALSNRVQNDKNFVAARGTNALRTLKNSIATQLSDHILSFNKAGLGEFAVEFTEMVEAVVKEKAVKSSKKIAELVTETRKELIDENFTIITSSNDRSTIIMPLATESNKRKVEAFLDIEFDSKFLDRIGLAKSSYNPELTDEQFVQRTKDEAFWVMNRAGDGVSLMMTDEQSGVSETLVNFIGTTIEFKFIQMGQIQQVLDNLQ